MYVVCRPFQAGDQNLAAGAVVDAQGWRNLRQLVRSRYLREQTADEAAAPKARKGREVPTKAN